MFQSTLALTGSAQATFWLGTVVVCLGCALIGELTMAGAYYLNRRHFARIRRDMIVNNNLSLKAIAFKDKESYTACNRMANDAFGLNFFSGLALFAASVWPAFFALSWYDFRFGKVPVVELSFAIPGLGENLFYPAVVVPVYVVMRIVFAKLIKPWLWPFPRIKAWVQANEDCGEELLTLGDMLEKPAQAGEDKAGG